MRPTSLLLVCVCALGFVIPLGSGFLACAAGDPSRARSEGADGSSSFGTAEAGACNAGCSDDLHAVLDCQGNVATTCQAHEGCAAGKCVPACEAAAIHKSSIGCDYFVYPPPSVDVGTSCLGAFVANTWGSPVKLTIGRGGETYNPETVAYLPTGSGSSIVYAPLAGGLVPPKSVALVLLNRQGSHACPKGMAAATPAVAVNGTGMGEAFRIQTDAPVVAYDIFPYGGGETQVSSATLLTPTTAWGDNYIGTTAYPATAEGVLGWLGIVAAEDGTEVVIRPSESIVGGGGVTASAKGTPITYSLNAGQYLQFEQPGDLTGSIIKANKPIASWGGHRCARVPAGRFYCDGMHQEIPPIRALGSTYVAVRYRNRYPNVEERPPWRVVGAVDGTTLTYDPPQPGAPTTIQSGQFAMFDASGPFVVRSQDDEHPFFFASYMTSCDVPAPGRPPPLKCVGDPEFVNVVPPDQYLRSYVFFTDPTYPETNLVFIRRRADDGTFKEVELDCAGVLSGWEAIGTDYEYTRIDLVRGNFEKQGNCDNGRHEAKSAARFGLTVWGWGSGLTTDFQTEAVSYAYPAGASLRPINQVSVQPVVK